MVRLIKASFLNFHFDLKITGGYELTSRRPPSRAAGIDDLTFILVKVRFCFMALNPFFHDGVLLHKWQTDRDVTGVEIILRVDWKNLGVGADFSLLCDRSACPGCPGCTVLPACWPTLLVTLMRESQASARNTQCLHFVSAKTVLLMISEHGTKIPGLFPHIFFPNQTFIQEVPTHTLHPVDP